MLTNTYDKIHKKTTHGNINEYSKEPIKITRIFFYLFIFSIPYETLNIEGITNSYFSLAKMIGYFFLLFVMLEPHKSFRNIPKPFWFFVAYQIIFIVRGYLMNSIYFPMITTRLIQQIQMIILFLIVYNMFYYSNLIKGAFLSYVISCISVVALQLMGIMTKIVPSHNTIRETVMSQNTNKYGALLAFALVIIFAFISGTKTKASRYYLALVWGVFAIVAMGLMKTGSRGAMLATFAGIIIYFFNKEKMKRKLHYWILIIIAIIIFSQIFRYSRVSVNRWEETINQGSLSKREIIIPAAWKMFLEKPIIGYGPVKHLYVLGIRLQVGAFREYGRFLDTHNLFLWKLTETGLIGFIPFIIAIWLCFKAALASRNGPQRNLPLALFITLMFINSSITFFNHKMHWVILAYVLASQRFSNPDKNEEIQKNYLLRK